MTKTLYALLVGIDAYQPPVRALRGCVNDIQAIDELLRGRAEAEFRYQPRVLRDAEATRDAIVTGFREHLQQAGPDDVALFYYSGHGSQEQAPPEFWHLEPDRLDETLVCYDSRQDGRFDLADKELAKLIDEVAARGPHLVVVLDCCHSGSGTRGDDEAEVRRAPTDKRPRPLDSFLVTPAEADTLGAARSTETPSDWIGHARGRHILLAGCRSDEEAKEYRGGGRHRGIFSYFLTETLQAAGGAVSYRDVFERAAALVRANIGRQAPQIEAVDQRELDRPFLGGAVGARPAGFTVSSDRAHGWVIDGGAVHGVQPPSGDDATLLALFAFDASAETLRVLERSIGEARVTRVLPQLSTVEITLKNGEPDPGTTYKALVTAVPLPALTVQLTGEPAGVDAARRALDGSTLVREAGEDETARLRLAASDGRFAIARHADARALTADIDGQDDAAARKAVQRLEHIARWIAVAELQNPASRLPANAVRLEVHTFTGPPATRNPDSAPTEQKPAGDLRLVYEQRDGSWQPPAFKLKLINRSGERLYCTLLDLTQRFAVDSALLPGGGVWLDAGQEAWALDGTALYASVPDELWQQGVTEVRDIVKLIASTEEFDATLLAQDKLDAPPLESAPRSAPRDTLSRLMQHATTREISARPAGGEILADWTTAQTEIVVVRPLDATPVPSGAADGRGVELAAGVELLPHPTLRARARLSSLSLAGRDLGTLALPPLLRDIEAQPWELTSARNGEPGLSVLELLDVEDFRVVTPEQPLRLRVEHALAPDEHVLPVGFDGELWLPLGAAERSDQTTVLRLDRLSDPLAGGERSLLGSIRIMLHKVVAERAPAIANRLGFRYEHPLLAAAYVDGGGTLTAYAQPEEVRERVAAAERIVLYMHGIIGDTRGMARSARILDISEAPTALPNRPGQPLPVPLADSYDLVLTFDYENINTSIENNARLLKERLAAAGLGPQHGKTLHIVAHSMGGLVSRWFVEREGGHRVVQRLVLLGTPNAGSPWPTVQSWATTALGIALNGLATVAWPVKTLGALVGAIETIDVSLDQMAPGSEFLSALAASDDPHVPYVVLAGNTATIAAVDGTDRTGGKWQRLLGKLSPARLLRGTTALAFFGQPNDIAVSVASIGSVPLDREPRPVVRELPCDHMSYFTTAAGLRALADAVA